MQPKHLYEYAIVRVVPAVEREEFVNVGVIVFCKRQRLILMRYVLREAQILALHPQADLEELRKNLESFSRIATGDKTSSSPIAQLDAAERFRWLTAVRSAVIQTSRPHPGISTDLEKTMENLFVDMVE